MPLYPIIPFYVYLLSKAACIIELPSNSNQRKYFHVSVITTINPWTLCALDHSMRFTPLYALYTTLCALYHFIRYTPLYALYTILCALHHFMCFTPLYALYTTLCALHHFMRFTPLYALYTVVILHKVYHVIYILLQNPDPFFVSPSFFSKVNT